MIGTTVSRDVRARHVQDLLLRYAPLPLITTQGCIGIDAINLDV